MDEGDSLLWEVDTTRRIALVRVVKHPIKFLKGRYSDPDLRYEVVEGTADRLIVEMTYADNIARPADSPG